MFPGIGDISDRITFVKEKIMPIGHEQVNPAVIGERIRLRRKSLKLTKAALARLVGVHYQTIWRYEKGRIPDVDELARLARVLGVTVHELLTGEPGAMRRKGRKAEQPHAVQRLGERRRLRNPVPDLERVISLLQTAPKFVPWVLGLLRIFQVNNGDANFGIKCDINAFLGDLGLEKVRPLGRRARPRHRKNPG